MRKITLSCDGDRITTTCTGTSQHIHNRLVVHGLSRRGKNWLNALPDGHGPVTVQTSTKTERLDYITADPLP